MLEEIDDSFVEKSSETKITNSAKKINVAFFTDILTKDYDGAIKTMYQLIDRIPENQFEYAFFCGTPPKQKMPHKIVKVPTITIPFNASYKAALPRLRKITLRMKIANFNPDVIHISTPSPLGFFALKYAMENHISVLSIYHTHFISYMRYYFKPFPPLIKPMESLIAKLYKRFYNECDLVYVPTTNMIKNLTQNGVSPEPLKLWQRGLDTRTFNPGRRDEGYIKTLTGNNKPCILYASRLVWEKNVETLFNIYDEAQAQQMDVNFVIAGSGVAEQAARERMPNAIFLGYLDHPTLGKLYASTDVFVFPSISESYGNVVVEAMACACVPVIARGGGSQSLVKDGETGFLCEPNEAADYVKKINIVLQNPGLKTKMQEAGYHATAKLSWENLAEEYFTDMAALAEKNRSK